jgi:hypothetical protein
LAQTLVAFDDLKQLLLEAGKPGPDIGEGEAIRNSTSIDDLDPPNKQSRRRLATFCARRNRSTFLLLITIPPERVPAGMFR